MIFSAHTSQFTQPGDSYFKHGSGVGLLDKGGSYVTFKSNDGKHMTMVVETMVTFCAFHADLVLISLVNILFFISTMCLLTALIIRNLRASVSFRVTTILCALDQSCQRTTPPTRPLRSLSEETSRYARMVQYRTAKHDKYQ